MPYLSKIKLNGIEYDLKVSGDKVVTGVKGNAEADYRHGDINLTPEDIGTISTEAEQTLTDTQKLTGRTNLGLGTAATRSVPTSGNANATQVVLGNDSRLSNARPASDVYEWAKAESKPSYTKSEVGLGNVPNVTTNNQTPTFTEASTRANIASGETLSTLFGKIKKFFSDLKTVAFTGSYNDLSNKPTIPQGTVTSIATGSGLKGGTITSSGTISTNVPRVAKAANSALPGNNTWVLEEFSPGSNYNLPTNHWYYIFSMQGSDAAYGAQLALGMTTKAVYYRRMDANTWSDWEKVYTTGQAMLFDADFKTKFRTETKGDAQNGPYIANIRTNDAVSDSSRYGAGLAWGQVDTNGYLNVGWGENADTAYIGGGNGDKLNWAKRICLAPFDLDVQSGSYGYKKTDGTFVAFRKPTGNAGAAQVLSGYTASNASSDGFSGSMPNNSTRTSNGNVPGVNSDYSTQPVRDAMYPQFATNTDGVKRYIMCPPTGYYPGNGSSYVGELASNFGNAAAGDVISGKTFTSQNGKALTGSFKHTTTKTPSGSELNTSALNLGEQHNYRYVNTAVCYNAGVNAVKDGGVQYANATSAGYYDGGEGNRYGHVHMAEGYYKSAGASWAPEIRLTKAQINDMSSGCGINSENYNNGYSAGASAKESEWLNKRAIWYSDFNDGSQVRFTFTGIVLLIRNDGVGTYILPTIYYGVSGAVNKTSSPYNLGIYSFQATGDVSFKVNCRTSVFLITTP